MGTKLPKHAQTFSKVDSFELNMMQMMVMAEGRTNAAIKMTMVDPMCP